MTRRIRAFFILCLLNAPLLTPQAWASINVYDGGWYVSAGQGAGRSFYIEWMMDNYINPGHWLARRSLLQK